MSYTKQNFQDGDVLTAEQMNKIDAGLYELSNKQKKISLIEISFDENAANFPVQYWRYTYTDDTEETVYDTSLESALKTLNTNCINAIYTGVPMIATMSRGEIAYTLVGNCYIGHSFELMHQIYQNNQHDAYVYIYITQSNPTSELVIDYYEV